MGAGLMVAGLYGAKTLEKPSVPRSSFDFMNTPLESVSGNPKLSEFEEPLLVLYFGYTFCPDACPTALAKMVHVFQKLEDSDHLSKFKFLFISVDPERDNVDRLKDYLSHFDDRFIGLTSDETTIQKLSNSIGVSYHKHQPKEPGGYYTIDHTTRFFVINKSGKIVGTIKDELPINKISDEILFLITHYS
jgi:protein SCO1/2